MKNKIIATSMIVIFIFKIFIPTSFSTDATTSAVLNSIKGENARDIAVTRNKNGKNNIDSLVNDGTTTSKTGTTEDDKSASQVDEITSTPSIVNGTFTTVLIILSTVPAIISTMLTVILTGKWFIPITDNKNVYTVGNLLANKYPLFDVDIFDTKEPDGIYSETIKEIRSQISIWYMTIRNLSIMILVVVLMYIAIRMLIGTSSSTETAKLKDMLIGWIRAMFLIFMLQYLAIALIAIANLATSIINQVAKETLFDVEKQIMKNIFATFAFEGSMVRQVFYFLAMLSIIWYQLKFFLVYAKRAMQVYMLLIIAPLICVSYPIDRIADDRGQALRQWLIDFSTAILMQPFQYMIYVLIFGSFDEIMVKVPLLTAIAFYLLGKSVKVAKKALQIKTNKEIDQDLDDVLKIGKK